MLPLLFLCLFGGTVPYSLGRGAVDALCLATCRRGRLYPPVVCRVVVACIICTEAPVVHWSPWFG